MGAAGNLGPDQGGLRVKDGGVDPFQVIPALVVVAVAGGGGEVVGPHPVLLHGGEYLGLIDLRRPVNLPESALQPGQNGLSPVKDLTAHAQLLIYGI